MQTRAKRHGELFVTGNLYTPGLKEKNKKTIDTLKMFVVYLYPVTPTK